jgi:nitrogen fixation/metabolism regulation signal transduction histidine kinase
VRLADGTSVGAVGIDYPLTYVDQIRSEARSQVLPVLISSYLVLLLMVLVLSTALVRPLRRLTDASRRVEEGEYDLDVKSLVKSRFPDEMFVLGDAFARMARKVGAREKSLTQEVKRLKVEIDSSKREEAVREITETDFFSDLEARAAQMRRRMREGDQ